MIPRRFRARFAGSSDESQAEILAFSSVLLWAWFPVLGKVALGVLSPMLVGGLQTLVAATAVFSWLAVTNRLGRLSVRGAVTEVVVASIIVIVVVHGAMFTALSLTTSGNVAILGSTEVLFSYLYFTIFWGERHPWQQMFGAVLIMAGAMVVLLPKGSIAAAEGELIALVGTLFAPLGNYFQRRAVQKIHPIGLLFWRSLLGGIFFIVLAFVFENPLSEVEQVREVWLYILLGGVCAMGVAKLLFLQSIKRASVPKVSSIILTYPAFTMLYALVLIGEQITVWSLSGLCFTLAGVWLVVRFKTERLLAKSS